MSFDIAGIGAVADFAGKLVDKFVPDPQAKAAAELELARMKQTGELAALAASTDLAKGQMAINAVEAASPSLFVSGWRPASGWVCVAALAYEFLVRPIGSYFAGTTLPDLDANDLYALLFGLLGIGTMRTWEKTKGVA